MLQFLLHHSEELRRVHHGLRRPSESYAPEKKRRTRNFFDCDSSFDRQELIVADHNNPVQSLGTNHVLQSEGGKHGFLHGNRQLEQNSPTNQQVENLPPSMSRHWLNSSRRCEPDTESCNRSGACLRNSNKPGTKMWRGDTRDTCGIWTITRNRQADARITHSHKERIDSHLHHTDNRSGQQKTLTHGSMMTSKSFVSWRSHFGQRLHDSHHASAENPPTCHTHVWFNIHCNSHNQDVFCTRSANWRQLHQQQLRPHNACPLLEHTTRGRQSMTTFGPTTFGPDHFWPRPLLARSRSDHFWPAPLLLIMGPNLGEPSLTPKNLGQ